MELVHWIQQILNAPDSDMHRIVRHFEVDASRLAKDLTEALDRLPRGATSISDLSTHVENAVERGWVYSTLMFGDVRVRTGHLMVGILKTPSLRNALLAISRHFEAVKSRHAHRAIRKIVERIAGGRARRRPTTRRWPRPARRAARWRRRKWGRRRRSNGSRRT